MVSQSHPSGDAKSAAPEVVRFMEGETLCGLRVAAWRETHPEFGDKFGHTYSEHWSTPSQSPKVTVERLFTEADVRKLIAQREALAEALAVIADGTAPPDQHGHYLAHREAVKIARAAIAKATGEAA